MQYIKAKFMKNDKPIGRSYTYRCEDNVKPGDLVANTNGTKLMVMDEPVDDDWIKTYGEQNIATDQKYVGHEKEESEEK